MEIEQMPVWLDIRKIFEDDPKSTRFEYKAILHTKDKDFDIMKIVTIDIVRDYVGNIGDVVFLEFIVPLGTFYIFQALKLWEPTCSTFTLSGTTSKLV